MGMSQLIDLKAVATQLGITPLQAMRLVARNQIPASMVGDRPDPTAWRVPSDAIRRDLPDACGPRISEYGRIEPEPSASHLAAGVVSRLTAELRKGVPSSDVVSELAAKAGSRFSETISVSATPAIRAILSEKPPPPSPGSAVAVFGWPGRDLPFRTNAELLIHWFGARDVRALAEDTAVASSLGVRHLMPAARLYASPAVHLAYAGRLADRFRLAAITSVRVPYSKPTGGPATHSTARFVLPGSIIDPTPKQISTIVL